MSEETVWQGLAAILPIFHWTVLGLNLMVTKNAELCRKHDERRSEEEPRWSDAPFSLREILHARPDIHPMLIRELERVWPRLSPAVREETEHELRTAETRYQIEEILQRLHTTLAPMGAGQSQWTDPLAEMKGGESLRFYNAAALGFVAEIGHATLLDHVVARQLTIARVTAGVEQTAAPLRTFINRNGEYVEVNANED